MKNSTLLVLFSSISLMNVSGTAANAASPMNLKPGLWEITMKINHGGKEIDPQAEIKKAMANMTPEQRKQMESVMSSHGAAGMMSGSNGLKVCYTAESLADAKSLGRDPQNHCENTIKEQSSSKLVMDFKCKDGSTGVGEWSFKDKSNYKGHLTFSKADGKKTDINQSGKFISADCGDVKPIGKI